MDMLVVDDDEGVREVTADILRVCGGHEVTLACSGLEARAFLEHGAMFEMIISDVDMGPLSEEGGIELLKWIRANCPTTRTPFILMSGKQFAPDGTPLATVASRFGGPTAFLQKPSSVEQLLDLVNSLSNPTAAV